MNTYEQIQKINEALLDLSERLDQMAQRHEEKFFQRRELVDSTKDMSLVSLYTSQALNHASHSKDLSDISSHIKAILAQSVVIAHSLTESNNK